MTNDEAIDVLKDMIEYGWGFSDNEKFKSIDACDLAIKALEDQRWIPVSDHLPEDCEDVFVTVKLQDAGQAPEYQVDVGSYSRCWQFDQHGRRIAAGGIWSYCYDWYEGQDVCEVIAWMPTPEPYKE